MNVFNNNGGTQGGFVFGSAWGLGDLKVTLLTSNAGTWVGDQLLLQPNFNTYANSLSGSDADRAFWTNSSDGGVVPGPTGNKWMEANVFVETNPITVSSFTFAGVVDANTLDAAYSAQAFIKVLDPGSGFATVLYDTTTLPTSGSFVVTSDLSSLQGLILQTGFMVAGLNANPNQEGALGSVTVTMVPEPKWAGLIAGILVLGMMARQRIRIRSRS